MSQKLTNSKLNAKQERFCIEYLVDFNGKQAAIRSGYSKSSARQIADQNLSKLDIRKHIGDLTEQAFKDTQMLVNENLTRILKIAAADIGNYMKWDKHGNITVFPSSEVDTEMISEVTKTETKDGSTFKFKLHDKLKGIELLGKYLGMYAERTEEKKEWTMIIKNFDGIPKEQVLKQLEK